MPPIESEKDQESMKGLNASASAAQITEPPLSRKANYRAPLKPGRAHTNMRMYQNHRTLNVEYQNAYGSTSSNKGKQGKSRQLSLKGMAAHVRSQDLSGGLNRSDADGGGFGDRTENYSFKKQLKLRQERLL